MPDRIGRLVFFGTPEFALPALDALVAAGRRPTLVVSQPARPAGRGRRELEPPVARRAQALGLALEQPPAVRAAEFLARLRDLAPDLAVVVAFGQIFPVALLELPRLGCVNLHASLLPRWRGAAPIPAAIAAGDGTTGVSIQRMEAGLDSGPVLAERATPIGAEETAPELAQRLARLGATLLLEVLDGLERGSVEGRAQDPAAVTQAPKLGAPRTLDLGAEAAALARQVRAYAAEPGILIRVRGEAIKLLRARAGAAAAGLVPGTVVGLRGAALALAAGNGSVLEVEAVQRPGGRAMSGRDLANGLRLAPGEPIG